MLYFCCQTELLLRCTPRRHGRQCHKRLFHPQGLSHNRQPLVSSSPSFVTIQLAEAKLMYRGMLHDPELYPDPFVVNPERYLGPQPQRDPRKIMFGFGRRICPGMYLAEASVFSCVASSLAVFSIEKARDETGAPITPVHENTNGTIR
jgi:hypothetical protein